MTRPWTTYPAVLGANIVLTVSVVLYTVGFVGAAFAQSWLSALKSKRP